MISLKWIALNVCKEMVLDALFLFNLGELAFVLADEYGLKEEHFG